MLSLSGCGKVVGRYRVVETLMTQEFSIGYRENDYVRYYVDAALQTLAADGTISTLAYKWFGEDNTSFSKNINALEQVGQAAPRTLLVGVDADAFPMSYIEGDSYSGFDVELMRRFALWCNASVTFALYDWNGLTASCVSGKTDYIAADLFVTPEKQEVIGFSQPYTQAETVMVVAAESGRGGFWSGLADSFQRTFLRENRWQLILSGLWVTVEITLLAALAGTALAAVPLFGMVKDDHHRTRAIVTADGGEIAVSLHRGVFTFLSNIQEEVHRFSIQYQRASQKKKSYASSLTAIPGVGPATAKALLAHFKTVGAVRQASAEELEQAKGVGAAAARRVFDWFHGGPALDKAPGTGDNEP